MKMMMLNEEKIKNTLNNYLDFIFYSFVLCLFIISFLATIGFFFIDSDYVRGLISLGLNIILGHTICSWWFKKPKEDKNCKCQQLDFDINDGLHIVDDYGNIKASDKLKKLIIKENKKCFKTH